MNMERVIKTDSERFDRLMDAYPMQKVDPPFLHIRMKAAEMLAEQSDDWQYYIRGGHFGDEMALSPSLGVSRPFVKDEKWMIPVVDENEYLSRYGELPDPLSEESLNMRKLASGMIAIDGDAIRNHLEENVPEESWSEAARRNPLVAAAWDDLPEVTEWSGLLDSDAFFSPFHFNGNEAFELPFHPRDYVYSPVIEVPVNPDAYGHYKRGVKKYRSMIERGETLPPVTILYEERTGNWAMQDGGHRSMAAAQAGLTHQPAVLAFPVRLLEKVFGKDAEPEDDPSP